jgi:processing peptidase subunit alpha
MCQLSCSYRSRLYTRVLNHYHWVQSCSGFNNTLNNTGLVGIQASCEPQRAQTMLDIMCSECLGLAIGVLLGQE